MAPTLAVDDLILVDRLAYRLDAPRHGDVVVLGSGGLAAAELLVKRVVGVPGDALQARGGVLVRNGAVVPEPYLAPGAITYDFGPVLVPPGHYWVMGDKRPQSQDSRALGPARGPVDRQDGRDHPQVALSRAVRTHSLVQSAAVPAVSGRRAGRGRPSATGPPGSARGCGRGR